MKTSIGKIKNLTSDYLRFHHAVSRKENGRKIKRMIGVSFDKFVSLEVSGAKLKNLDTLQFMLFAGDDNLSQRVNYVNEVIDALDVLPVDIETVNELEDGHKFIFENVTVERDTINNIKVVFITII